MIPVGTLSKPEKLSPSSFIPEISMSSHTWSGSAEEFARQTTFSRHLDVQHANNGVYVPSFLGQVSCWFEVDKS